MRTLRPVTLPLAATLLVSVLAGCEPGVEGSPQQAAESLAAAIQSGDFSAVPMVDATVDDAAAQREEAFAGMGDLPLRVEVLDVEQGDEELPRAEGTLRLTWDLPGDDLVQEAPLRLRVSEGAWTAAWEHALLGVARGERLDLQETAPQRADIEDQSGRALVTARPVWRFGIDKTKVPEGGAEESARALAGAAGMDEDGYADAVASAGPEAFVELITYRVESPDGVALRAELPGIEGAFALEEERVLGPTRTFAQPLLGAVGPVTAEMVEEEPERFEPGDVVGLTGLSAAFDEQLSGTPGLRVVAVDADSGSTRTLAESDGEAPEPLRLTLDSGLQRLAEEALADIGPPSAIVALDVSTGDVLAMANGPGSAGVDTALSSQYAPGSVFKLATALALVRQGLTPASTVRCEPTLVVDGYRFHNVPGYPESALGDVPLSTAIAHSCNTALIGERDRVPMADLAAAAEDLGMGAVWEMPVTAFSGSVPQEAGSDTEHAASLIGQGRVLASPAAIAAVAATIAQGEVVVPRIVADQEVPVAESALTAGEAEALRELMRGVVTEGGATLLADNPGEPVLAKTGTAEFGDDDPPRTHTWMIGIQGDLAVSVFVEEGSTGAETAGPILDRFLTEMS